MKKLSFFLRANRQVMAGQAGFSLMEILISLTLLGIVGTFVTGKVLEQLHEGKVKAAHIQMKNFEGRLKEFKRKCGFFPATEQGLDSLINKPTGGRECRNYPPNGFIDGEQVPKDPWDEDYIYVFEGKNFNIISYGADNVEGGEGEDQDLSLRGNK